MSHPQDYSASSASYGEAASDGSRQEKITRRAAARPTMGRKRGKTPTSFNGIHRRRRRKLEW